MTPAKAVALVASKFRYTNDKRFIFDLWFVMRDADGVMKGDCDDFTITCLWEMCGRSLRTFIWKVLITHQYKVHRVKSTNGYHVVGEVDGLWFDNWTLRAMPKAEFFAATGHRHQIQYVSPVMLPYLISGLFVR